MGIPRNNKRANRCRFAPCKNGSLVNQSGFAGTAEAHQHTGTEQSQHDAARFGNGVDLVRINPAGRGDGVAQGVGSVSIQPEGGDRVPGKGRCQGAAECQNGSRVEAQIVPSTGGGCPNEVNLYSLGVENAG